MSLGLRLLALPLFFGFIWIYLDLFGFVVAMFSSSGGRLFVVGPCEALWDDQLGEECEALFGSRQEERRRSHRITGKSPQGPKDPKVAQGFMYLVGS